MSVVSWYKKQTIGPLRQRNMPGNQGIDEPEGASWGTLIAVRML